MRAQVIALLAVSLAATPAVAKQGKPTPKDRSAPKTAVENRVAFVEPPPVAGVSKSAIKWSGFFAFEELKGQGFDLVSSRDVAKAHARARKPVPSCGDEPACLAEIGKVAQAGYVVNVTVRPAGQQLGVKLTLVDAADAQIVSNIFSLVFSDDPKTLKAAIKKQAPRVIAALQKHIAEKPAAEPPAEVAEGEPASSKVAQAKPEEPAPSQVAQEAPAEPPPAEPVPPAVAQAPATEPAPAVEQPPAPAQSQPTVAEPQPQPGPAVQAQSEPTPARTAEAPAPEAQAQPTVVAEPEPAIEPPASQAATAPADNGEQAKAFEAPDHAAQAEQAGVEPVAASPTVNEEASSGPGFLPYAMIGVGAVATGVGVGLFGLQARQASIDFKAGRDPAASRDTAKSKAMLADITAGAGVALMAAGGAILLFSGDDEPASAGSVSVVPTVFGAAVSGSF